MGPQGRLAAVGLLLFVQRAEVVNRLVLAVHQQWYAAGECSSDPLSV